MLYLGDLLKVRPFSLIWSYITNWNRIVCKYELTQQAWDQSLWKACWQPWPFAGLWELLSGRGPTIPSLVWLTVPKLCKRDSFCWTPACIPGVWNLGTCPMAGFCVTSPKETPDAESLMGFPGRQYFTEAVKTQCWVIKHNLCDSPGTGPLEACSWSPLGFIPWGTFSLCWFVSSCCNKS